MQLERSKRIIGLLHLRRLTKCTRRWPRSTCRPRLSYLLYKPHTYVLVDLLRFVSQEIVTFETTVIMQHISVQNEFILLSTQN